MAPEAQSATGGGRGARGRILRAALELFRHRGITATGVSELSAAAHVSKRTLYQHFAGKDELVLAYLRALEADPGLGPEGALSRDDLTPRARLLELFSALGDERRPFRGCPFVAAAIEFPDPGHPVHRLVTAHKLRFADQLIALAADAGARPSEPVGRRLALLYDGAAAQLVALDAPEPAADAFAVAAEVLDNAIG